MQSKEPSPLHCSWLELRLYSRLDVPESIPYLKKAARELEVEGASRSLRRVPAVLSEGSHLNSGSAYWVSINVAWDSNPRPCSY